MATGLTTAQNVKLARQIKTWQDDLVNLTRRNRLLYFQHTKSATMEIISPSLGSVWRLLDDGPLGFFLPPDTEDVGADVDVVDGATADRNADDLVVDGKSASDIKKALRNLERTTVQTRLDKGLSILHVACGFLHWVDPADGKPVESPLLLLPVDFEERRSSDAPFKIVGMDEEPVLNPALVIKLTNDFGIDFDELAEVALEPAKLLPAVSRLVAAQPGWTVTARVVLATFTFHKEAMYRDLLDNAGQIAESPLIQAVALGADAPSIADLAFEPPQEETLDLVAPTEVLVSVTDADSTQRACIVAARDGRSFVMDGPPGTGKSQTITNMIAELLHAGRTVLFVSEKAAALDVVNNRLESAGLGEFALELHSHTATRKEVAVALGRALTTRPQASSRFSPTKASELARLRADLNAYAIAMNVVRQPLGRSLHDVLGRILQLQDLPHGPVAGVYGAALTADEHAHLLDAAERLSRAWGPVELGDDFVWRSLADLDRSVANEQRVVSSLRDLGGSIRRLQDTLRSLSEDSGLPPAGTFAEAEQLCAFLDVVEEVPDRDQMPPEWLCGALVDAQALAASLRTTALRFFGVRDTAERLVGTAWRSIDHRGLESTESAIGLLGAIHPSVHLPLDVDGGWFAALGASLTSLRALVSDMRSDADEISRAFGLPISDLDVQRARELSELGSLLSAVDRPEASWLNPVIQAALAEAEAVLAALVTDFRQRRDSLRETFRDTALELDLVSLRARFKANTGLRKLGGTYRSDKKLLAGHCVSGKVTATELSRLDDAVAWKESQERLSAAEGSHASLLGRYYEGAQSTDLNRLGRALALARRALSLVGGSSASLDAQLALGGSPSEAALAAASRLAASCARWEGALAELRAAGIDPTGLDTIEAASAWCVSACDRLAVVQALVDASSDAATSSVPLATALAMQRASATSVATLETFAAVTPEHERLLGPRYAGLNTDFQELDRLLGWAERVAAVAPDAMEPVTVRALLDLPDSAGAIRAHLAEVQKRWSEIVDLFQPDWRQHLDAEFQLDIDDAVSLTDQMATSVRQIDEWERFATAVGELDDAGMRPTLDFIMSSRVASGQVVGILERSLLERWVDVVLQSEPALRTAGATDRDALVQRFRDLDREQVANARARVIQACSDRRPRTAVGVAGVIRREAEKRTRHMPIRKLLHEARDVALALKPCFMMSPLSVSQFLPPDLQFDVVIFDEASQVRPSEAANCIYRGKQLIVAGDPKQLPPTSFFDAVASGSDDYIEEDPDDFESVLDACRSSGLPVLPLLWHYRSQHESLITYSNYSFYRGDLQTFPSALQTGPDVGVELIQADGVYRRGAGQDNPLEAEKVIERVLHHRRLHPDLTVGVVAFSGAQESAIAAVMERLEPEHPELAALRESDRLDGFFIKNLENVQGDERDIIIFSIGYGPDENGKFSENLGPLNRAGGERRLNVAITRARRRVEIVSSITASSFHGGSASAGVRHLRRYLDFAERGVEALAIDIAANGGDTESPFEEEVLREIVGFGFDAVPQVGVAGFRIDLAVPLPSRPGKFAIGIECDGAAYHSSRVARDRDRLRQDVLERLGWEIYRVWGPSWYYDRAGQSQALRQAIERAIARDGARAPRRSPALTPPVVEVVEAELDAPPDWVVSYEVAGLPANLRRLPAEFTNPISRERITEAILEIADREGPVHEEVVRRRVSNAYGISRMGALIREAYDEAFRRAIMSKRVRRVDAGFLATSERLVVRIPGDVPETMRPVAHVSPRERQLAIARLVGDARRITEAELLTAFARLFGWKRAGVDIQAAFSADLRHLAHERTVLRDGEFLTTGTK